MQQYQGGSTAGQWRACLRHIGLNAGGHLCGLAGNGIGHSLSHPGHEDVMDLDDLCSVPNAPLHRGTSPR
ncbi:hypothetical protein WJX75_001676 [Coccomyxa subellipsoidea]|uniref:Uncharacterized protein n=1 Tax=Coccomyxa subellipsoidea TaxID=248742 RepID=A0ABR2YZ44_9CHLO